MAQLTKHLQARTAVPYSSLLAQGRTRQRCRVQATGSERHSHSSVLANSQPRALVVAIDHNQGSCRAFKWTLEHMYRQGDVLHLLHVVPAVPSMVASGAFNLAATVAADEGEQEQLAAHAESYMAHLARTAVEAGAQCEMDLVVGRCNMSVSDTICSKVDELGASVLVLSVQPTSLLEGWWYPSISKQVVAKCTRPTLIFHG